MGRWEWALQREALLDPRRRNRESTLKDNELQTVYTTFILVPALKGIILLKLILSFSGILNLFDSMFILSNNSNRDMSLVLDTHVYERSIRQGHFASGSAMGVFKNLFGVTMTVMCNEIAKRLSDDGRGIF